MPKQLVIQGDQIACLVFRRVLCIVVCGAFVFRRSVCLCRGGYVDQAIHQGGIEGGSDRRSESRQGGRVCSGSGGRRKVTPIKRQYAKSAVVIPLKTGTDD